MTLSSTTVKSLYNGDSSTKAFSTGFIFWNSSELEVILVSSSGNETTWTEGTQYSVTGGGGATGTVTASTTPTDYTPASGSQLLIRSALEDIQATSLPAGGVFPSTAVEQELDRIVRRLQEKEEELTRSIKLAVSSTFADLILPAPSANKMLRWNAAATALENADLVGSSAITVPITIADGGTGATTAAGARTSLDTFENVFTTRGDLLRAGSSGTEERVALGSDNQVLASDGTDPAWETLTSLFDAVYGSSHGSILYRASTQWTSLSAGSSGQVLRSQAAGANPIWSNRLPTAGFTSSTQSVSADTQLDVAHSLGSTPIAVQAELLCTGSTGNAGYSLNERIILQGADITTSNDSGAVIMVDSTNVSIITGAQLVVLGKSSFNSTALTLAQWSYVVRAWI